MILVVVVEQSAESLQVHQQYLRRIPPHGTFYHGHNQVATTNPDPAEAALLTTWAVLESLPVSFTDTMHEGYISYVT